MTAATLQDAGRDQRTGSMRFLAPVVFSTYRRKLASREESVLKKQSVSAQRDVGAKMGQGILLSWSDASAKPASEKSFSSGTIEWNSRGLSH